MNKRICIAIVLLLCALWVSAETPKTTLVEEGETITAPTDGVFMPWEMFIKVNDDLDELEICHDAYKKLKENTIALEADWNRYADELEAEATRGFWRGFGIGGAVIGGALTAITIGIAIAIDTD